MFRMYQPHPEDVISMFTVPCKTYINTYTTNGMCKQTTIFHGFYEDCCLLADMYSKRFNRFVYVCPTD